MSVVVVTRIHRRVRESVLPIRSITNGNSNGGISTISFMFDLPYVESQSSASAVDSEGGIGRARENLLQSFKKSERVKKGKRVLSGGRSGGRYFGWYSRHNKGCPGMMGGSRSGAYREVVPEPIGSRSGGNKKFGARGKLSPIKYVLHMNTKMIVLVSGLAVGWGASSCKKDGEEESAESRKKKLASTEARSHLKLMSNNARTYYSTLQREGDPNSLNVTIVAKQFPKSAAINPPLGDCCKQGRKCSPGDGTLWDDPSWVALDFAMTDPHYYSYQFTVGPDGRSYTALAYGDLDCDGTYSTYSVYGQVVDGEVQSGKVVSIKPLE